MTRVNALVFTFSLLGLLPLSAALDTAEPPRREFRVAVDSWPPFRILDAPLYTGIDIELWTRLSQQLQLTIHYVR